MPHIVQSRQAVTLSSAWPGAHSPQRNFSSHAQKQSPLTSMLTGQPHGQSVGPELELQPVDVLRPEQKPSAVQDAMLPSRRGSLHAHCTAGVHVTEDARKREGGRTQNKSSRERRVQREKEEEDRRRSMFISEVLFNYNRTLLHL